MTDDRNAVMRKIAALLRLAAKPGTVGEAAAAAARAQALMDRYELTRDMMDTTQTAGTPDEPIESFGDKPEGWIEAMSQWKEWKWVLVHGIAKLHGCFVWRSYRAQRGQTSREARAIEIVGRASAVSAVRYFYEWMSREAQRLVDEHGRGMGQVWRREFLEGAAHEIVKRLEEQRSTTVAEVKAEYAANPMALVKVEHALARMQDHQQARDIGFRIHGLHRGSGSRSFVRSDTAREAGAKAARTIDLGRTKGAIGGKPRQIGSGS